MQWATGAEKPPSKYSGNHKGWWLGVFIIPYCSLSWFSSLLSLFSSLQSPRSSPVKQGDFCMAAVFKTLTWTRVAFSRLCPACCHRRVILWLMCSSQFAGGLVLRRCFYPTCCDQLCREPHGGRGKSAFLHLCPPQCEPKNSTCTHRVSLPTYRSVDLFLSDIKC